MMCDVEVASCCIALAASWGCWLSVALRPQKPQGLLGTGRKGDGDMEVGKDGDYIPIATLSPQE